MQFEVPTAGIRFAIPDDWWSFAEMNTFAPSGAGFYPYSPGINDVEVVLLSKIEALLRNAGVPPFRKYKLVSVLLAFLSPECALPPVEVIRAFSGRYDLKIINGYHRYYASVAVGYTKLPVVIRPAHDQQA